MKTTIIPIAAALFSAGVSAADVYQGFADGNPDLFKSDSSGTTGSGVAPDIYGGVSGNPDLQF